MINGWQTAAILSSVKCVLSRNDTVVSCHLLQTTRHSWQEATYRRNVFHPHLEATADSKVLEKRDETAHLSSPRPVHLVRGLAQNGVSTISNSICLCRMKKAVTLVIMFPLLIPELIQPERLPKRAVGSRPILTSFHTLLLPSILRNPIIQEWRGLEEDAAKNHQTGQRMTRASSSAMPPPALLCRGRSLSTQMQTPDTLHLGADPCHVSTGHFCKPQ